MAASTSSVAATVSNYMIGRQKSCELTDDSSDGSEMFSTPPTSPPPPERVSYYNRYSLKQVTLCLVVIFPSCLQQTAEWDGNSSQSPTLITIVPSSFSRPELKDLDLIELVDWEGVGLQLGVKDYELQKIKQNCKEHNEYKREMFRVWLRTCTNPNYHDLTEALEAKGERNAAQQLKDKK